MTRTTRTTARGAAVLLLGGLLSTAVAAPAGAATARTAPHAGKGRVAHSAVRVAPAVSIGTAVAYTRDAAGHVSRTR